MRSQHLRCPYCKATLDIDDTDNANTIICTNPRCGAEWFSNGSALREPKPDPETYIPGWEPY